MNRTNVWVITDNLDASSVGVVLFPAVEGVMVDWGGPVAFVVTLGVVTMEVPSFIVETMGVGLKEIERIFVKRLIGTRHLLSLEICPTLCEFEVRRTIAKVFSKLEMPHRSNFTQNQSFSDPSTLPRHRALNR